MKVIKQAFPREIADTLLEPIRSKKDYLMFLMEVSKLLLLSHPFEVKENGVEVELVVKKFSRIFCASALLFSKFHVSSAIVSKIHEF